ncbi:MAG: hydrogenase formation protein HypD [Deltaproteobacteria bacterium]|nr:hydrogenase formation protein HypD [Deltaproteobacteria bacterium]
MTAADVAARFRDPELVRRLARDIARRDPGRPLRFMHVCGTHENYIGQYGIRDLLPPWLKVIAGPGCPVCVCPAAEIDLAARLALDHQVVLATFGDVLRVPARLSLFDAKARGADVRVVYSAADAVAIARAEAKREVVFFAVGFETTACTVASALALGAGPNFSIVCSHRLIPPALKALLAVEGPVLSGYLLPGHVMTVMGTAEYEVFPREHHVPLAVAGFEPVDILLSLDKLVEQVAAGAPALYNGYPRAVKAAGNVVAKARIAEVFEPCDASWRGIGTIPRSGLRLRAPFAAHDAAARFGVAPDPSIPDIEPGCSCHLIMLGKVEPADCPLFGNVCVPEHPVGPCMVSMEGTCRAWYQHRRPV